MHANFNHLEVVGLACERGEKTIFAGLDFDARSAEVIHLKGRNGSGKTSLLRILCGFSQPLDGSVRWNGTDIRQNIDDFCLDVTYVGHRRGVCGDLTPLENVRFANALTTQNSDSACRHALERVELADVAETPARLLSAGQNQRTALARLLISDAALWLLDEPFTALDPAGRAIVELLVTEHSKQGGISIIATHQSMCLGGIEVRPLDLGAL